MIEYCVRVRRTGDTYTASIREHAPSQHPDVRAVIGPVVRGEASTALAAVMRAFTEHSIPEFTETARRLNAC